MAARSLTTAATLFAGPGGANSATPAVNGSSTFHVVLDGTVQTLSTTNAPDKDPIKGLLFVPGLDDNDPCNNLTIPFIPPNVTRHQDVLPFEYNTIGLAPWISTECTQSFLDSSRRMEVDALVFYIPSHDNEKPPGPKDSAWMLDENEEWKSQNNYPVYAIPGLAGATLMNQLSMYSGDTIPPDFQNDSNSDEPGIIRLITLINLEHGESKLPSLWGFILAILGTILVLSIILLMCYQLVQSRRRENLRRRIEAGEADLEELGLHQIKVPREIIDTIPVYIYADQGTLSETQPQSRHSESNDGSSIGSDETCERRMELNEKCAEIKMESATLETTDDEREANEESKTENEKTKENEEGECHADYPTVRQTHSSCPASPHPGHRSRLNYTQTMCAICLEEYESGMSVVRELPCGHIFHPQCIDTALTQSSCLCPLCKKSVLPTDTYPVPVTNRTVHRDYMLHRSRWSAP
ncbi:RING finger domain protein [Aspergillus taichungensis]|uniref:RING finger domain protein n=1 Tax=Aspergillus taichungensis TaxID=482145 RepID=A0A2J5I4X6_9EURO|nr:RING finger domain protein [Aspergillus taichungensis]